MVLADRTATRVAHHAYRRPQRAVPLWTRWGWYDGFENGNMVCMQTVGILLFAFLPLVIAAVVVAYRSYVKSTRPNSLAADRIREQEWLERTDIPRSVKMEPYKRERRLQELEDTLAEQEGREQAGERWRSLGPGPEFSEGAKESMGRTTMMAEIEGPVTRAKVRALASDWADDPATVVEVVHAGFNADPQSGGYAFLCDKGLLTHGLDGGRMRMWSVDPGDDASRVATVDQYWRNAQHRNRHLELGDLSEWHRAAIAALTSGCTSVADLPPETRPGVTDISRADYLFVHLRRYAKERTEAAALRALAANDWLMELPRDDNRAHPCPICDLPAIGKAWQYLSVCDDCYSKTVCADGRIVTGYNTSFSGGFEAKHVDDKSVCAQVTRDGLVWIDAHECHMGEAKFGGVFVGVEPRTT